jgi:hypothetical protein
MAPIKTYHLKFWSKAHGTTSERKVLEATANAFTMEL